MGQFTNGVLVGLGISLLFAPKKGEEVRRLLVERYQTLRGNSQGNEKSEPQMQPMAESGQETPPVVLPITDFGSTVPPDLDTPATAAYPIETDVSPTTPLPKPSIRPTQNKSQHP